MKWGVFYIKNKDFPFCLSPVWNIFPDKVERTQNKEATKKPRCAFKKTKQAGCLLHGYGQSDRVCEVKLQIALESFMSVKYLHL